MKTIDFNIQDRQNGIYLLNMMQTGSRLQASLIYDLLQQLDFKPAEIEELSIKDAGNGFVTAEKDKKIDVNLTIEQIDILKSCIDIADNNGAMHYSMIPLINRIEKL